MKASLLLTHGYFLYEDPKELQIMKPYAPLGLLYLCSHLRAKGYEVEVFDTTFAERESLIARLQSGTPQVLGIYANLMTRANVVNLLGVAKEAGWTTIVGGPEPGAYAQEYLQAGANYVVMGEGELTPEELMSALSICDAPDVSRIAGLAYMTEGRLTVNSPRAQIECLDDQPWPERKAINIQRYVDTW